MLERSQAGRQDRLGAQHRRWICSGWVPCELRLGEQAELLESCSITLHICRLHRQYVSDPTSQINWDFDFCPQRASFMTHQFTQSYRTFSLALSRKALHVKSG